MRAVPVHKLVVLHRMRMVDMVHIGMVPGIDPLFYSCQLSCKDPDERSLEQVTMNKIRFLSYQHPPEPGDIEREQVIRPEGIIGAVEAIFRYGFIELRTF